MLIDDGATVRLFMVGSAEEGATPSLGLVSAGMFTVSKAVAVIEPNAFEAIKT